MSEFEQASQRLTSALEKLEQVISEGVSREVSLHEALEEAQAENRRLNELNKMVASRLDAAMARLEALMEE